MSRSTKRSSPPRSVLQAGPPALGGVLPPDRRGPGDHVHVAASLFHDIAPANELGLRSVWINRLDERSERAKPDRELSDPGRPRRRPRPTGACVNLRAPTLDDVPGITRLFNRGSEELFGEADEGEDDVRRFLTSDELDPAEDIRLAEADGELVGYADIYPHPHPTYWVDVRVAPSDESLLRTQLLD